MHPSKSFFPLHNEISTNRLSMTLSEILLVSKMHSANLPGKPSTELGGKLFGRAGSPHKICQSDFRCCAYQCQCGPEAQLLALYLFCYTPLTCMQPPQGMSWPNS